MTDETVLPPDAEGNERDASKKCPRCAEMIKADAVVCRYCGHEFSADARRLSRIGLSRALVVVIAVAVAGVGVVVWAILAAAEKSRSSAEPPPGTTFTIDGTLEADECGGGYEITFASVDVRDQNGKLIGSSTTSGDEKPGFGCQVSFDVEVPKARFYQVEIGTHGGPSYSFEEMEAQNWQMDLVL